MKTIYSKNTKSLRKSGAVSREEGKFFLRLLKRRYFVFIVLFVFAVSGLASGLWIYYTGVRIFPIRDVVFMGNKHIIDIELRSLAGVKPGDSLFALSARTVSDRLARSPWIKSVSIRKVYPDKILIKVNEAAPFAILQMKGNTFLIDENGSTLDKIDDTVPFLPVIAADPARNRESFAEALNLTRIIREKGIAAERGRVEVIADKGPEDMAIVIDNLVIKIGSGEYKQKLERFFYIEKEIEKRAIAVDYVDLRFTNKVIVKPIHEVVR